MKPAIIQHPTLIIILLTIVYSNTFSQILRSSISIESETLEKRKLEISVWPLEITSDIEYSSEKVHLQNKKSSFSMPIESLSIGRLIIKGFKDTRPIFFIEPGEHVNIKVEIADNRILYEVVGNDMNDHISIWNKTYQPYYEAKMKVGFAQKRLDFVTKYPSSKFSSFLLIGDLGGYFRFPIDTLSKYSILLSEKAMDSSYGRLITNKIENATKNQVGINITNSLIDSLLSLSTHKAKYIVLDFWATWCGSRVKEIPDLKNAYERHKDKAHFISISVDEDKKKWERFVFLKNMNWEQILDYQVIPNELGVDVYPTKIIIDPEGYIIYTFIGEHPEFYDLLDKILIK